MLRFQIPVAPVLVCLCGLAVGSVSATGASAPVLPDFWRGRWSVVRDLGAPGLTALTDAQARQTLGTVVELDDRDARFGQERCEAPAYLPDEQSLDDFLFEFKITPNVFRLAGDRVRTLDVRCRKSITHTLAALENGCVISARDGRFFQLARLRPDTTAFADSVPPCLR